jgi:hypothetical protein
MALFESNILTEASKKYYLYAKVLKTGTSGTFLLSETSIAMEGVAGYYHLLAGILNSEFEGERSFVRMYGFTEILPGQVFTDVISDPDRNLIINLVSREIIARAGASIIGKIVFESGTSGYDNISDKPNLTEWANYITNNAASLANQAGSQALSQANANAATTVQGAREELAKQLGYASYAALAAAATAGKTIINGGLVRTSLIDAEAIVTQSLVTKWITAAYINAMEIVTAKLTVNSGAKIGGFNIIENRLDWKSSSYFGDTAFALTLGNGLLPTRDPARSTISALVNSISFDQNLCGVAAIAAVGCAIYGSTDGWGSNFPGLLEKWAGYFSGNTYTTGYQRVGAIVASNFRYLTGETHPGSGYSYSYLEGISFDPATYDLDKVRFRVRGGLIVGVTDDNGKLLQGA